jgi:hypothetical protein
MSFLKRLLAENTAAVASVLGQRSEFDELYECIVDEAGGFPGVWSLCADAAICFTEAEYAGRHVAGETYEWIDAISDFVNRIFECCISGDGPYDSDWQAEANSAIKTASFPVLDSSSTVEEYVLTVERHRVRVRKRRMR